MEMQRLGMQQNGRIPSFLNARDIDPFVNSGYLQDNVITKHFGSIFCRGRSGFGFHHDVMQDPAG
jgi:hypothetical protein